MRNIILVGAALLVLGAVLPHAHARQGTQSYRSTFYSFSYPKEYVVEEWFAGDGKTLNGQTVLSEINGLKKWDLRLSLFELGPFSIAQGGMMQEFAVTHARFMCDADGMDASITCPKAINVQPFKNMYGVHGFRMMLHEETVKQGKSSLRLRGPVAVMQIGPRLGVTVAYEGKNSIGRNRRIFNKILSSLKENKKVSGGDCVISGCSNEICAETELMSTCLYRPEYVCYKDARCERQKNGECGWAMTLELNNCLAPTKGSGPACTQEAKLCPDGSAVGRTGHNCEFSACP